jgi:RNA polymerase sigma-70 factor (ECF subfamily)
LESETEVDCRDRATRFVELLTAHQRDLYAYINTLLFGESVAADVLQDTNLDLWSRLDHYDFSRPFVPWAFGFAYRRVLVYRKTQSRTRLMFNDDVLQLISETYVSRPADANKRLAALQHCLDKLHPTQGKLVRDRYMVGTSVNALASRLGTTANQISARLYRIRKALAQCVEGAVAKETR